MLTPSIWVVVPEWLGRSGRRRFDTATPLPLSMSRYWSFLSLGASGRLIKNIRIIIYPRVINFSCLARGSASGYFPAFSNIRLIRVKWLGSMLFRQVLFWVHGWRGGAATFALFENGILSSSSTGRHLDTSSYLSRLVMLAKWLCATRDWPGRRGLEINAPPISTSTFLPLLISFNRF